MTGLSVQLGKRVGNLVVGASLTASDRPVTIVGPNGAGKTTLLLTIVGALRPDSGRVTLDGQCLFDGATGLDVPVERRRIGFLPRRLGLFPHLDAVHNVAYGVVGVPRRERLRQAMDALAGVNAAALAHRFPSQLSGGEAQRVALARAIAARPRALLLDEPLAALDAPLRRDVRRYLAERLKSWRIPTIVVTHDLADAAALGGEVLVMERGSVTQRGSVEDLEARPATSFVRALTAEP